MISFQKRLKRLMRVGNFTVADLAFLFKRPDPTVRSWVNAGFEPRGGAKDVVSIFNTLKRFEARVKKIGGVPTGSTRAGRRFLLTEMRR